jgi:hypothetical protein
MPVMTTDTGKPYLEKLAKLRKKTERAIWEAVNEGGMTVFELQGVTGENWRYLAEVAGKLGTEEPAVPFEHQGMGVCNKGRSHFGACDFGNGV